jgi:SAM-dependent methyltransferase
MEERIFHDLARAGTRYWWNQGRQTLVRRLWERYAPPAPADRAWRILDIGCAAGGTLAALAKWGEAWGLDLSAEALALCRAQGLDPHRLVLGDAERMTAFEDGYFDLVTAVEILEHVEHPDRALAEIRRVLRPGGLLILTVPADPKLWSDRDERLGHHRRYRAEELAEAVRGGGFEVLKLSYANAFYYWPFRWLLAWRRLRGQGTPRVTRNTFEGWRPLDALFVGLLRLETAWILRARLPWGVSAVCVARSPRAGAGRSV